MIEMLDEKYGHLQEEISGSQVHKRSGRKVVEVRTDGPMLKRFSAELRERLLKVPSGDSLPDDVWTTLCGDIDDIIRKYGDTLSQPLMTHVSVELRRSRARIRQQFRYEHPSLKHQ